MSSGKTVIAFDLYGTLLSTESIAKELAKIYGDDKAPTLAANWRRYQLEYTWRINSMGLYRTFSEITKGALEHAVAEQGLSLSSSDNEKLMKSYDSLHVFPEIPKALEAIKENAGKIEPYIFTNGTQEMIGASVKSSPDLGPYADLFKAFVTVHEIGVFKPSMKTYEDLVEKVGKRGEEREEVWVVSANPFDVVGARVAGLRSAWIDRAGKGWVDRLGDVIGDVRPTVVVGGVDEAVGEILKLAN